MKALIFDLDDTLVADEVSASTAFLKTCLFAQMHYDMNMPGFHAAIRELCRRLWYESPAREYCVKVGVSSWEGLWADFGGTDPALQTLREWAPIYRRLSWSRTLQCFGIEDEEFADILASKFIACRRELHVVYSDVLTTLNRLRPVYKLGLLTNGLADLQREKIAQTGIGRYFDAIVISGDWGYGKPDRRIFDKMLSELNVTPESAMMIGDSQRMDIRGAQGAGMKTAWVNRCYDAPDEEIRPDLTVYNLNQFQEAMEGIERPIPSSVSIEL